MLILNSEEKEQIANMHPESFKYLSYPSDKMTEKEAEEFFNYENINIKNDKKDCRKLDVNNLKLIMGGWANQMYSRFGFPVYLVGSSLNKNNPRDIDVRIILSDEQFEVRYGSVEEWAQDTWRNTWRESRQKWAEDMIKLSKDACRFLKLNIDLQVMPKSFEDKYYNFEKIRLDSIKENYQIFNNCIIEEENMDEEFLKKKMNDYFNNATREEIINDLDRLGCIIFNEN